MKKFNYNQKQYNELEALSFNLFVLRFKENNEFIKEQIRDTVKFELELLDNLNVPYWVQNEVIFYVEQKLKYKYSLKEYLSKYNITPIIKKK